MSLYLYNQHLFLRERFFGSFGRTQLKDKPSCPPKGYAFFCPTCSELWANCPIVGQQTNVLTMLCDKHPAWSLFTAPGSMWLSWDKDWQRDFPMVLAKREFELMIKLYEGGQDA